MRPLKSYLAIPNCVGISAFNSVSHHLVSRRREREVIEKDREVMEREGGDRERGRCWREREVYVFFKGASLKVSVGGGAFSLPLSSFLKLTCLIFFSSVFKRKAEWESFGKDGCGEEDVGSRFRRWRRHLKACCHQGLWNGKLNAVTLFGSRSKLCPFCCAPWHLYMCPSSFVPSIMYISFTTCVL